MTSKFGLNSDLAWRVIDGEVVILKVKTTTYYSLDPVGSFIWSRMKEGPQTRQEMLGAVLAEFEVEQSQAAADLDELISDLVREELLTEIAA